MKKQIIINIIGRSNSGKTTIVEKLVTHYRSKGKKVSALKSMRHDFDIDHPGKDSARYRDAGAFSAGITNGEKFAFVADIDEAISPMDIIKTFFKSSDIVILEGYREGDSPKVEVIGDSVENPLYQSGIKNIKILVSDRDIKSDLSLYKRNDIEGIIAAIEKETFFC